MAPPARRIRHPPPYTLEGRLRATTEADEAETREREQAHKARLATFERIVEHAPAALDVPQLRFFVELLLDLSPYGHFEEVAEMV